MTAFIKDAAERSTLDLQEAMLTDYERFRIVSVVEIQCKISNIGFTLASATRMFLFESPCSIMQSNHVHEGW